MVGDGEIKTCNNFSESNYLEYEETITLCLKCGNTVSYFEGED